MSDYLCEELIVEIFTRLPPKSLLRFRSLSKSLYSCISSPGFIRMHTFRSPQKIIFEHLERGNIKEQKVFYTLHGEDKLPLCLCPQRGYIGITTTLPFPCNTSFKIVGSCNGTFCLQTKKCISLWNPSIRRKLSVPECPQRSKPHLEGIGFGFDSTNDDYKIVWMSPARGSSFVYAVKTGTWCEIASPKPQFSELWLDSFSFNGVLHWVVNQYLSKSQDGCFCLSYIMTFNLSTHVFGTIPLPGPTWQWLITRITTIQDSLALICYGNKFSDTWIWVWRDDSWSVGFKLETGQFPIDRALQLQPTNNGDLLLANDCECVLVYNPNTGVRSRVVDFGAAFHLISFDQCVETLHLLNIGETVGETTISNVGETTIRKILQHFCFRCI